VTEALCNALPSRHRESDFVGERNPAQIHEVLPSPLAQNGASESARQHARYADSLTAHTGADLGSPLTIGDVAALLGCSAWTVRQRYLRQGLPHLQARARGKLVFFREQVIAWIEKRQQQRKGGIYR